MSVTFGGLRAVDGVDLHIDDGQIVGLIGPNGAGKTTFIDGLTGYVPITGRIHFVGRDIETLAAHHRARAGLGRTWQSLELFDDLSVEDNLRVAAERQSIGGFVVDLFHPARRRGDVAGALDILGIAQLAQRMPNELSAGQRKLVSAARAVASRPRVLCMDEPAAGLDTAESAEFARRLRALRDTGITVLLVDHDMGLVLDVCDYVYSGCSRSTDCRRGTAASPSYATSISMSIAARSSPCSAPTGPGRRRRCCASRRSTRSSPATSNCSVRRSAPGPLTFSPATALPTCSRTGRCSSN
jgi:branched-chain amino acid transport system ATP-binding protein